MPKRHASVDGYRYGFQGQEKDDEIKDVEGSSINYKFRMHDPRVGRFFSTDPIAHNFPWNSPYAFSENVVINAVELEGLEKFYSYDGSFLFQVGNSTELRVVYEEDIGDFVEFRRANMACFTEDYGAKSPNSNFTDFQVDYLVYRSHEPYKTADDAALGWGDKYNDLSANIVKKEFGSAMYKITIEGKEYVNFTKPIIGDDRSVFEGDIIPSPPSAKKPIALIHSHGHHKDGMKNNEFYHFYEDGLMKGDIPYLTRKRLDGYLIAPDGSARKYDYKKQEDIKIAPAFTLPYDFKKYDYNRTPALEYDPEIDEKEKIKIKPDGG